MKKLLVLTLMWLCLFANNIFANDDSFRYVRPSADYTADQLIRTGPTNIFGLWIITDGTNNVTIDLYDNTAASGTTLIPSTVLVADANNLARTLSFDPPIHCYTGLYVDVTTAGTVTYKVYEVVGK